MTRCVTELMREAGRVGDVLPKRDAISAPRIVRGGSTTYGPIPLLVQCFGGVDNFLIEDSALALGHSSAAVRHCFTS